MTVHQLIAARAPDQKHLRIRRPHWNDRAYVRLEFQVEAISPMTVLFDPINFEDARLDAVNFGLDEIAAEQKRHVRNGQKLIWAQWFTEADDWELFAGERCDGDTSE